MARFTDTKQPKTPTAPRPDNFRTYLAVRRSRFVPREAPLRDASNSPVSSPARALRIADGADEVHKVTIAKHYLKFWFWVDLISTLPIELILDAVTGGGGNGGATVGLDPAQFRLFRLCDLCHQFRQ